jgi:hypothetical protein
VGRRPAELHDLPAGFGLVYHPELERHLLHTWALMEAVDRQAAEKQAAADARRTKLLTCTACGVVGDDVQQRTIGGWRHQPGVAGAPRLCIECARLLVVITADEWVNKMRAKANEETPNGKRGTVCKALFDKFEMRFLP